jgi:hypothetical protein
MYAFFFLKGLVFTLEDCVPGASVVSLLPIKETYNACFDPLRNRDLRRQR